MVDKTFVGMATPEAEIRCRSSYDHFTGGRFRHGTSILRCRPDKRSRQCNFAQLQQKIDHRLMAVIIPTKHV